MKMVENSGHWGKRALGEVASVISGYAFKSSEFGERGIPVIKIKNIRVGHVDLAKVDRVNETYLKLPERYHVRSGDILISLTGSHISQPNSVVGRVARHAPGLPTCLLNQRAGKVIIKDRQSCDPRFLFYALSEQGTLRAIAMKAHGAASQANVSPTQVESVEIHFPPFPVQQSIASILSAYDELIENGLRRITLLDSIARTLYKEWFVHLRFPGHESHTLVDSPSGRIPVGWEAVPIGQLAEVVLGGTPSRSVNEYWMGGDVPWLNSGKLNELRVINGSEFITRQGLDESAAKLMPPKTVLVAITGAILISFLEIEACANQSVIGIYNPKRVCAEYLHIYLTENIFLFESKMSGSAQQHINKEIVEQTPVLIPLKETADAFRRFIEPLYSQIAKLHFQVQSLSKSRELLMPRMLSGQTHFEVAEP